MKIFHPRIVTGCLHFFALRKNYSSIRFPIYLKWCGSKRQRYLSMLSFEKSEGWSPTVLTFRFPLSPPNLIPTKNVDDANTVVLHKKCAPKLAPNPFKLYNRCFTACLPDCLLEILFCRAVAETFFRGLRKI